MREFFAVIVSFLIIPVLSKKKIPIGIAICFSAVIMALLGGLGLREFWNIISNTFFNFDKVQQLLIIAEISIIGVLLSKYKIIDEVLKALSKVINSKRLIMMFIPALIGMLSVPGGAIISAPIIDQLGEKSNLSKPYRAIINLIYRHISVHVMPYTAGFLLVLSFAPQISIYKLLGLNAVFTVMYIISGYYLYLKKVQNDSDSKWSFSFTNLINFIKYTSPIYVAVLLNLLIGVPFYIGMLVNLMIVFWLHPTKTFLIDAAKAFNINVLYALIGVYLIQGVIDHMESLTSFLALIFANPNTVMLGIVVTSFFFGVTTGFPPTALGVVLPILVTLPLSENMLLMYCHFTFVWGFAGYFFSPLHLCQLFTCEYLKVSMIDLYKDYWKFFVSIVAILIVNYFVFGFFLR